MAIDELERIWKEDVAKLRYHPGICLAGLRKATKSLSQDSLCVLSESLGVIGTSVSFVKVIQDPSTAH
jgi:hypothetical protein